MRARLRRLEREARGEVVEIPQRDGTVARFPRHALADALANLTARLGAGSDAPPEHPLPGAVRNSDDPEWARSAYLCEVPEGWVGPVEDLSE